MIVPALARKTAKYAAIPGETAYTATYTVLGPTAMGAVLCTGIHGQHL